MKDRVEGIQGFCSGAKSKTGNSHCRMEADTTQKKYQADEFPGKLLQERTFMRNELHCSYLLLFLRALQRAAH